MSKTALIHITDPLVTEKTMQVLSRGDIVAVPTDTVYGIACDVKNQEAIQRLFAIKSREQAKAIPVLIGGITQLAMVTKKFDPQSKLLAKTFWPGALTLILAKSPTLPKSLSIYPTVGVRMPDHGWLRELMLKVGPLAVTSANISGQASPITAEEVINQLNRRIDLIVDGGPCQGGISSTVVDCTTVPIRILREGAILSSEILELLNKEDLR